MKATWLDLIADVLALVGWFKQNPSVYWMMLLIAVGLTIWRFVCKDFALGL